MASVSAVLKFRLQRYAASCTSIDHVYPSTVRGTYCYCEQHRWGIESIRREHQWLDENGYVHRTVRGVLSRHPPNQHHPEWVFVLALHGCGHLKIKTSSHRAAIWRGVHIRCRMCERVFRELQVEANWWKRKRDRKRHQELKLIQLQLSRKRLMVKIKRRS